MTVQLGKIVGNILYFNYMCKRLMFNVIKSPQIINN